jgi:hypothetical protein
MAAGSTQDRRSWRLAQAKTNWFPLEDDTHDALCVAPGIGVGALDRAGAN